MDELIIAVPKGRLLGPLMDLWEGAGLSGELLRTQSRRLVIVDGERKLKYILAKPGDVPTYVEYGAADLGVVGKDVLLEEGADVSELLDLDFGRCQMVVAVPKERGITRVDQLDYNSRVATKYPNIARDYFSRQGLQVEVIKLGGSIELGPMVGLAEAIVDITETGGTLLANDLEPIAQVAAISARLIVNPIRYRVKLARIQPLVDALSGALERKGA
ncbi:MAG: ATP phosphoribosyltransferase [Limnochordia bacterium]|jgi:ATP phosphoribosyltransferase|nr:ATP phosphoribosyltransferase [Bacillota bacterium]